MQGLCVKRKAFILQLLSLTHMSTVLFLKCIYIFMTRQYYKMFKDVV